MLKQCFARLIGTLIRMALQRGCAAGLHSAAPFHSSLEIGLTRTPFHSSLEIGLACTSYVCISIYIRRNLRPTEGRELSNQHRTITAITNHAGRPFPNHWA
jgi:hypothetical protein